MKQKSSIKSPEISSKTYVRKTSKSLQYVLFRRAWVGFLAITLILLPIAGLLWNPQHNTALADTAIYGFAKQMGGTGSDSARGMTLDDDGNIYITGNFNGTVDFDPGAGTANLTSAGGSDIHVTKLDSDGDFVWAKKMGGTDSDRGNSIAVDADGNSYITGTFEGTADFDPGVGTSNLVARFSDIYVVKLDVDGNFVWAKLFGGASSGFYNVGNSITVDDDGNVYTTGNFDATVDFDPGAGTSNLTSSGGITKNDIFISKLNSAGDYVWAKSISGNSNPNDDTGTAIEVDASGNVYTTGYFPGTSDFDPGAGTANLVSAGDDDIFISKLNSAGDYVWAKSVGGASDDYGWELKIGNDGNIYLAGSFFDTVDFDPGPGTENLLSTSGSAYILVLDTDGDYVTAKNFGGSAGFPFMGGMKLDEGDNIYVTGNFNSTADFDPGSGTSNLVSLGATDIFIAKYDSDINLSWAKSFGSAGGNEYGGYGIALDTDDNVYTIGEFSNTVDFDPGAGTANLTTAGSDDIYISKLSQVSSPTVTSSAASDVNKEGATLNGNITSTGGSDATERGFEYGLTDSYGSSLSQVSGPYSTGAFADSVTGLSCETLYYFRAYATGPGGTSYGSETTFTTSNCSSSGSSSSGSSGTSTQTPTDTPQTPTTPETPTTPTTQPTFNVPASGPSGNPSGGQIRSKEGLLPPSLLFTRNLGLGSVGQDVQRLQQFMNANGYSVSTTGAGATNQETTFFGARTKAAVKVFQEAFASEILTPLGLTQGTGYFGSSTRAMLNSLIR